MKTILPALIFLLFNGVLLAQDNSSGESTPAFPNPGVELGGQISFSSTSISDGDYSTTVFSFEPYIGAMLGKTFEIGFYPGIATISNGHNSVTAYQFFLAPCLNSSAGSLTAYVEGLVGYASIDPNVSGLGLGGSVGLKFQIIKTGIFKIGVNYVKQNYSASEGGFGSYSTQVVAIETGFRIFLAAHTKKK